MTRFSRLQHVTVLIVENEALVRGALVATLADLGAVVLQAEDGDDAIAKLDEHPEIELIVTDIMMPGSMDGARLAHHVRDRWPPVKIIVTSGIAEAGAPKLPAGALFLAKPYSPEAIGQAYKTMIRRGAAGAASRMI